MTNISSFAKSPIGEAGMISSYDRKGGNIDWANFSSARDGGFFILADLKGPGVVRRIWQTSIPQPCEWLFYFDGEELPSLTLSTKEMFHGKPPFCSPIAMGENGAACSYVPIPYKESLIIRIKLESVRKGSRPFFQINYETFPTETVVRSLKPKLSKKEQRLAQQVCDFWANLPPLIQDKINIQSKSTILPGTTECIINQTNAGNLEYFAIKLSDLPKSYVARNKLLRVLWLKIYWDNSEEPSVEVPLGDFFCNGLAKTTIESLPIRVNDEWFECGFPMPFTKNIRMEISNYSNNKIDLELKALTSNKQSKKPQYFHAYWNQETRTTNTNYNVLSVQGKGHFIGCYVTSLGMDGSWYNLEGDDSFIVDGKLTMHGTGLEDYFNGGWYYKGLLNRPIHGVTQKAAMRTSQYRFHLTTPVAFRKSLDFNFEFGDKQMTKGYMSSVAYWYQDSPTPAGTKVNPEQEKWFPPINEFTDDVAMAELLEIEKTGRLEECAERAGYFGETLKAYQSIYKLRSLAYHAELDGYETVSNKISELKRTIPNTSQTYKEIEFIEWFNKSPTNALLSFMSGAHATIFLDNKKIGTNEYQVTLATFPVNIQPEEHILRAELKPTEDNLNHGLLLTLKTETTNIISNAQWKYTTTKPINWPHGDGDDRNWSHVYIGTRTLPTIYWWQLTPNAMVMTQSGQQIIVPWNGWGKSNKTTYLRYKFIINK
jgi:hypothetical protein